MSTLLRRALFRRAPGPRASGRRAPRARVSRAPRLLAPRLLAPRLVVPRLVAPAVLVLCAAALSGCAGTPLSPATAHPAGPGVSARPHWPDPVPTSGLTKGLVLPMEAYMVTYPEEVALRRAVDTLESRCMARYGFAFRPPPAGTTPPPSNDDANMARRYGVADRAQAARFGYAIGDENETPPAAPALSAAARTVLTGRTSTKPGAARATTAPDGKALPPGGCAAEAANRIDARIDTTLPGRLDAQSLDASQADPRVRAVIQRWSRCMKGKGYAVDNPLRAATLVPEEPGHPVTSQATATATADVDCKSATGLVGTWFGVEKSLQQREVAANRAALEAVREQIAAAVKAAGAVTG